MVFDSVRQGQAVHKGHALARQGLAGVWLLVGTLAVLLPIAWISDDALITLHQVRVTIDDGMIVWNPGVRVQAFSHPLWFGLLTGGYALTGSLMWMTVVLSLILALLAVGLLWRFAVARPAFRGDPLMAALFTSALLLCSGFVDYTTSGLETPLSYALSAGVLWLALDDRALSPRVEMLLWGLLAALVLTRIDHALLFGPLAVVRLAGAVRANRLWPVVPGAFLLLAWFAFATVYFGSPLPNTYFAKLSTGIAAGERLTHGVAYLVDAFVVERVALPVALFGVFCGLLGGQSARLMALGLLVSLVYLLWIGGDFMRGRFLALPFFIALFLVAAIAHRRPLWLGAVLFAVPLLVPTVLSYASFGAIPDKRIGSFADERAYYWDEAGAFAPRRVWPEPGAGNFATDRPGEVVFGCAIGRLRFESDATTHIVDTCALTDPFLARLEAPYFQHWRIGHHVRALPRNYDAVSLAPEMALNPPRLAPLHAEMRLIAQGDLADPVRFAAILRRLVGLAPVAPKPGADMVDLNQTVPFDWTIHDPNNTRTAVED